MQPEEVSPAIVLLIMTILMFLLYIWIDTWTPEYNNANPTYPALALDAKTYNPSGQFTVSLMVPFSDCSRFNWVIHFLNEWTEPLRITNLKLYVNGRNLFLWTKMPNDGVGMDDPGY